MGRHVKHRGSPVRMDIRSLACMILHFTLFFNSKESLKQKSPGTLILEADQWHWAPA